LVQHLEGYAVFVSVSPDLDSYFHKYSNYLAEVLRQRALLEWYAERHQGAPVRDSSAAGSGGLCR
jgi:hypothetical protein